MNIIGFVCKKINMSSINKMSNINLPHFVTNKIFHLHIPHSMIRYAYSNDQAALNLERTSGLRPPLLYSKVNVAKHCRSGSPGLYQL